MGKASRKKQRAEKESRPEIPQRATPNWRLFVLALAKICSDRGIQRYPTWIIGGRRHEGVLTLTELARYSAFQGGLP